MRFFLTIIFLFSISAAFAQQDTLPSRQHHELYFGVNLTRLIVKDYELELFCRLSDKKILGVSIGYDFNRGEEMFTDTKAADDTAGWHSYGTNTSEGETRETSRYFFGKGPVFRITCDFLSVNKKKKMMVATLELLCKIRNYNNYYYQEHQRMFLESASQQIYGITAFGGKYYEIENFLLLRTFFGFGFRYLNSNIVRPVSSNSSYSEERFSYHLWFPTVHLGLSMIIILPAQELPKSFGDRQFLNF